ncbi:MAG: hypothetical protein LBD47_09300 [Treponema sp.]|nr:hypothetical protein [Treponema sp.]
MMTIEQTVDIAAAESPAPESRNAREPFPTLEELKAEARRKTAERLDDPSGDSLQKYCGCLKGVFLEDGVECQWKLHDEWPD